MSWKSEAEQAAVTLERTERQGAAMVASAELLEGRKGGSRLDFALELQLKVHPQPPDSMWIVNCWREGLEQLGAVGLEARILELKGESNP